METRYLAVRVRGEGAGEVVHTDVPLSDVSLTNVLSGPHEGSATVLLKDKNIIGSDKQPLFGPDQEWGLALFAEVDGVLLDEGGIMTECVEQQDGGHSVSLDGYTFYPSDSPYTEVAQFVREDGLNIFRHIWNHLQSQPGGNLGMTVDDLLCGVPIGLPESDDSNSDGPYMLNPWSTHNLMKNIDDLATQIGFDWHEKHYMVGDQIAHHIELGYPQIGRRREDGALVVGENVRVRPAYSSAGPDYASDILVLGAGEGRAMVTGTSGRSTGKLRRVKVVNDKAIQDYVTAANRANRELRLRTSIPSISQVVVWDVPEAPVLGYRVGDEVPFIDPNNDLMIYVRILSRTVDPAQPDTATLTVARTDVGAI